MMELPTDSYFESNISSIKLLASKGFGGVYISFQRPYKNISSLMKQEGINMNNIIFREIVKHMEQKCNEKNLVQGEYGTENAVSNKIMNFRL